MTTSRASFGISARWIAAAALVLAPSLAPAQEALVTELAGTAHRSSGKAFKAVRTLDKVAPGEKLVVKAKSRATLFVAAEAALYEVEGPAEIQVTAKGLRAAKGKLPAPRKLDDAYRGLKVDTRALAQGSLVMRGSDSARVESPEGFVEAQASRRFRWSGGPGGWQFELATDSGELVHRAEAFDGLLELPAEIALKAGTKYVWGIAPVSEGAKPVDWTEFVVSDSPGAPPVPEPGSARSEKLLYAAWLRDKGMPRAAARMLEVGAARP